MKSLLVALAIILSQPALAGFNPDVELPRQWAGTFTYHSTFETDYFQVTIEEVEESESVILARGIAKYFSDSGNYTTDLRVEWTIQKETRFIQILDVEAVAGGSDYDTSGSYSGSMSWDLDSIIAIYRGLHAGSGTLKLRAVDSFPDYSRYVEPPRKP